jgi:hypothetical protein
MIYCSAFAPVLYREIAGTARVTVSAARVSWCYV